MDGAVTAPTDAANLAKLSLLLTEVRTLLVHALEDAGDCPLCDGHGTFPTPIDCGPEDEPDPCSLCAAYNLLLNKDLIGGHRDTTYKYHRHPAVVCRERGWGVGTRLVGDEGYGPTVIEITAVGEESILARAISHAGKPLADRESSWVLWHRDWQPIHAGDGTP